MSHRIGSVVAQSPAFVVGPGSGLPPTSPGVWERPFSPPQHPDGTKFLMLHFTGANLSAGDQLEVVRSSEPDPFHAKDVITAAEGSGFWSRPVAGNSVVVRYVDGGDGAGQAAITEYGRGEGIRNGGDSVAGGKANGDVFMLDASWDEPTFFNAGGVCPSGSSPSWENVAVLPAGVMREAARSVGMFIVAHGDHLSSCSVTLIAPDLIFTASHCVVTERRRVPARSRSTSKPMPPATGRPATTLVSTSCPGLVKRLSTGHPGRSRPGRDYSIVQVEAPPAGLGETAGGEGHAVPWRRGGAHRPPSAGHR